MAGRYEEASAWCDKTLHERPDFPPALRMKAATCGASLGIRSANVVDDLRSASGGIMVGRDFTSCSEPIDFVAKVRWV
jgi:hypothetical protein